jgi:hypothetical protein
MRGHGAPEASEPTQLNDATADPEVYKMNPISSATRTPILILFTLALVSIVLSGCHGADVTAAEGKTPQSAVIQGPRTSASGVDALNAELARLISIQNGTSSWRLIGAGTTSTSAATLDDLIASVKSEIRLAESDPRLTGTQGVAMEYSPSVGGTSNIYLKPYTASDLNFYALTSCYSFASDTIARARQVDKIYANNVLVYNTTYDINPAPQMASGSNTVTLGYGTWSATESVRHTCDVSWTWDDPYKDSVAQGTFTI